MPQARVCSSATSWPAATACTGATPAASQIPDDASLARWEKQRTAQLERMKARAEKQAAE
ncbi:MAG: hypothetical protein ACLTVY_01455 [Faecalibacterium sp.]